MPIHNWQYSDKNWTHKRVPLSFAGAVGEGASEEPVASAGGASAVTVRGVLVQSSHHHPGGHLL